MQGTSQLFKNGIIKSYFLTKLSCRKGVLYVCLVIQYGQTLVGVLCSSISVNQNALVSLESVRAIRYLDILKQDFDYLGLFKMGYLV